ncbi:hypothetical protein CK203_078522 [Vitis vinifera]|uniref:Uncharacterized protein n=1 Tax=Vitis vinifera TaxID=29760 RepID=A0A438FA82_VITVI|nr:hypothetical protein CK203_078522 [Vitis vinifera]
MQMGAFERKRKKKSNQNKKCIEMVKDSKENQVIPVEDVVRKDSVEYQALSSNGSLLCDASAHDGSSNDGQYLKSNSCSTLSWAASYVESVHRTIRWTYKPGLLHIKLKTSVGIQFSKLGLEDWSSSNLTALSNWLGMPTVGFKAKILALLRKMKARKEVRG